VSACRVTAPPQRQVRLWPGQRPVRANWRDLAVCTQMDPEVFFPTRDADLTRAAKAVCHRCSVRDECLATAVADASLSGIWGGTSAEERARMRDALA
jgi:WhiB family redox-sensing transcriptional regulator